MDEVDRALAACRALLAMPAGPSGFGPTSPGGADAGGGPVGGWGVLPAAWLLSVRRCRPCPTPPSLTQGECPWKDPLKHPPGRRFFYFTVMVTTVVDALPRLGFTVTLIRQVPFFSALIPALLGRILHTFLLPGVGPSLVVDFFGWAIFA